MKHLNDRWNDNHELEALKETLELEKVPEPVDRKLRQLYIELPDSVPERRLGGSAKFLKGLAGTMGGLAAAFLVLIGVSAVNPALAEELPLVGALFRQYNQTKKTAVGTYIDTFGSVSEVNAPAAGTNTEGLTLTVREAYSDGAYIHLSFTMDAPEESLEKYDGLSLKANVTVNGKELEPVWLGLDPAGERFAGTAALRLDPPATDGETLSLAYETADFIGVTDGGSSWENLSGTFSGSLALTADASHNRVVGGSGGSGGIRIEKIETTPSYTKISYEIPFWGVSSYTVDFPQLYTPDGTQIRGTVGESDTPLPESIPNDSETIVSTHFFDGLPAGTEKVILRFMDADAAYSNGESEKPGVLGEVTIELATGKAVPSETYLEAGFAASNYRENFLSLSWRAGFDDISHREGYPRQMDLFDAEDLFQSGIALEGADYAKDGGLTLNFLSTELLQKDLELTLTGEDGKLLAAGSIAKEDCAANRYMLGYSTEEEMLAGLEKQLREEGVTDEQEIEKELSFMQKTEPGKYYCRAELELLPGRSLKVLDTATVTLSDPDTRETLYTRTIRFVRYRNW